MLMRKTLIILVPDDSKNFILSHIDDTARNHPRRQSNVASVYRCHKLGRPAAAFLSICVINDAGDK